ncbi:MAG: ABC transporter ATP-binding protein [Candidatus Caldarchaeales archaeon]
MISIRNLSFSYGNLKVLKDISLDLFYGEFVGVVGPNGSGKTTLLKCLCKLLKPLGAVYIDGEEISRLDLNKLSRKISYLSPEVDSSMDELTVFELVSSGRTPYMRGIWWESRDDEKIILDSIKIVGLDNLVNRKLKNLSSGEKQMARVARALSQKTKILLIDEPTIHLDLKHQIEIMSILKRMVYDGALIIAVFHDLNLASAYVDKIIVLKRGEVVVLGKPADVLTEEILREVYDINVKILRVGEDNVYIVFPTILT